MIVVVNIPYGPEAALQAKAIETEVTAAIQGARVQIIDAPPAGGAAQGPPGLPQGPPGLTQGPGHGQLPGGPAGQLPQRGGALGGAGLPLPGLTGAPSPGMPPPGLAGGPMGPGGLLGAGGSPRPRGPVGLSAAAPQTARRRQGGQGLPGMPVRRPGAA
jgi:hypothetical protein